MRTHGWLVMGLFGLVGCPAPDGGDSGDLQDTADTGDWSGGQITAVVATVSEDYSTGSLATVSLDGWTIDDELAPTNGDPAVFAKGEYVFVAQRFTPDVVRAYAPGSWVTPVHEWALAAGANPQDVEICGGKVFVSEYEITGTDTSQISVHDLGQGGAGGIDLSTYADGDGEADADGTPEASSMVVAENGKLYVGLQNFDRNNSWIMAGGRVLEVDCGTQTVTDDWSVPSADVFEYPADPSKVVVYGKGEGYRLLDTGTGDLSEVLLDETTEGLSFHGFAATETHAVILTTDGSYNYGIGCVDLSDWALTPAETTGNYLTGVWGNDRGEAWVAARTTSPATEAPNGTIIYDIDTCTSKTVDDPVETLLAPYSIAFY